MYPGLSIYHEQSVKRKEQSKVRGGGGGEILATKN
jgi:hypothetical protein